MVDHPTNLDAHRGMAAQKATDIRRLRAGVEADQAALRARQADLEDLLAAAPASNWAEAVEKARYLLGIFAQSAAATDPRHRKLIDRVIADFDHLLGGSTVTSPLLSHKGVAMAKGQQRSDREAKKPRKDKPTSPSLASPFVSSGKGNGPAKPPGGKR
jgi:hypothetical protein